MKKLVALDKDNSGLNVIERTRFIDDRGAFERIFCKEELSPFFSEDVSQINLSSNSTIGTVRGLHYQTECFAEKKYVICLAGKIMDVVVDLREGSPTFLKPFYQELSAETPSGLLIPKGFAHGFQTLLANTTILYIMSAQHNAQYEKGINPLDPMLSIDWPLTISNCSARDKSFAFISQDFEGVYVQKTNYFDNN